MRRKLVASFFTVGQEYQACSRPICARRPRFTGCNGLPEGGQRLVSVKQLAATIVVASCGGPAIGLLERAVRTGQPPPPVLVIPPRSFPPVEELVPRL